ncbi:hypothetical protein BDFB_012927, partial [Asbolus verrucosus]
NFNGNTNYNISSKIRWFLLHNLLSCIRWNILLVALNNIDQWKTDSASEEVENRIKIDSLYLNTFMILNTILSICCAIFLIIPDKDDIYWCDLFSWTCRLSFLPVSLIMTTPPYLFIHSATHFRFQSCLSTYYLENINSGYEELDEELLLFNREYQMEIKKRLKFFIERHNQIFVRAHNIVNEWNNILFLFALTGTILGISIGAFVFTFKGSYEDKKLRMTTMIIVSASIFINVIISGEKVENIYNYNYNWNKENLKIYLIILTYSQDEFKMKLTENCSVNYELGV